MEVLYPVPSISGDLRSFDIQIIYAIMFANGALSGMAH